MRGRREVRPTMFCPTGMPDVSRLLILCVVRCWPRHLAGIFIARATGKGETASCRPWSNEVVVLAPLRSSLVSGTRWVPESSTGTTGSMGAINEEVLHKRLTAEAYTRISNLLPGG